MRKTKDKPVPQPPSSGLPAAAATPPLKPREWAPLLLALALPLFFCAAQLNLDLWYDEAFTLQAFVEKGLAEITTNYSCPNNHLFYLILLRPFFLISNANAVLRLPALFFAAGTLLCLYRVLRRHVAPGAGVLGLLWLGLNQMFLGHAMQLRGYGLSMFLTAALADLTLRFEPPGWGRRAATALVLFCFLYTLPSNILFAVPLAGAAILFSFPRDRRARALGRDVLLPWGAGALLAGLCYLPILRQILATSEIAPGNWSTAWNYLRTCFPLMTRDAQWLWWALPLGLIFRLKPLGKTGPESPAALHGRPRGLLFLTAILLGFIGPFIMLGILRKGGLYIRNFTPALPFLALFAGWMLWEILEGGRQLFLKHKPAWTATAAGGLLLGAAFLPSLFTYPARLSAQRDQTLAQDGYYNYYAANFHVAAPLEFLKANLGADENYMILTDRSGFFTVPHYCQRLGLPNPRLENKTGPAAHSVNLYYLVPTLANYADLTARCGLGAETLKQFPMIRDFGYFKLYKSPLPLQASAPR